MIKEATKEVGATQWKMPKKHDISVAMVNNILNKSQIQYSKRKTVPKFYQQGRAQKTFRKHRRDIFTPTGSASVVYESYSCLRTDRTPANSWYCQEVGSSGGDSSKNVGSKYKSALRSC